MTLNINKGWFEITKYDDKGSISITNLLEAAWLAT